jgi:hypothetical protein
MSPTIRSGRIKVADEVWVATALLHREHPERSDFSVEEIVERAHREGIVAPLAAGVYVHASQHCVANRRPSPNRYRMLFETATGRRRLFRHGDLCHPQREGSKIVPRRQDLPQEYNELLDWYQTWDQDDAEDRVKNDPLLSLYGSGKDLWADEHADEYIRRLREGWQ